MDVRTYRFNTPISALQPNSTVTQLPLGTEVIVAGTAEPDSKGMTAGTYLGYPIIVFQRDLDEQADRTTAIKLR